MKLVKAASILVALAGFVVLALVLAPVVHTQRTDRPERRSRDVLVEAGGAALGVSVRDVEPAEAEKQKIQAGVVVEDVMPDTPADKAGIKRGDVIVQFDGEAVRSASQFTRLVREAAPGRTVKATIVRDGRRSDVQVTPDPRGSALVMPGELGDYMRELGREMGRLGDRIPPFDLEFPGVSTRRLGVTVQELTTQLADYFGAKDGILVTSVTERSAAAIGGLKAGDVITTINGEEVRSRADLVRGVRNARPDDEITLGIVRDRKASTLKVKIEPRRSTRTRPA